MFSRFVFAVALANLLFNFFCDQIDRRIKIAFRVFREEVWARNRQAHAASELALGNLGVIMLQRDTRIDGEPVEMFELVDSGQDVIFNGLC